LGLADYEAFALPAVKEIIAGIGSAVPVIYYTKASHHLLPAVARCGADVLSLDWRVNLRKLRELLGPGVALQGNVDPAILLGPAEQVRNATLAAAETLNGVGHILNLGHGILPATPVENARIFIETGQRTEIGTVRPVGLSR
jgi:uroporphyrinogen decarboxylase